jgi:ribonuclease HI
LQFKRINNRAKYKACIIGLEAVLELKAKLDFYGHSLLIICQVKGE